MKFPRYVKIENGNNKCCLRLDRVQKEIAYYWRDGGQWGLQAHFIDGQLISLPNKIYFQLSEKFLIPISLKECREDNGKYWEGSRR